MKPLTKQQMFNKVAMHLLTQREQSVKPTGCFYRGPNGLKCAIGVLMPDDCAKKADDQISTSVRDLPPRLLRPAGINESNVDLASRLQTIHDAFCVGDWIHELVEIAEEHHLDPGVIDRATAKWR